jgi:hypothetical protein
MNEFNFWIPANSSMNSCYFSICCSLYDSLFKKSRLSKNGEVLAENELSEWDPCWDIHVPVSGNRVKTGGRVCPAFSQQVLNQILQFFFWKKPHGMGNIIPKFQPFRCKSRKVIQNRNVSGTFGVLVPQAVASKTGSRACPAFSQQVCNQIL